MPWNVTYHPGARVVETTFAGQLSPDALTAAVMATLAECRRHGAHLLLADCSTLEGGHSIVDLYDLAMSVAAEANIGDLREAVLVPATEEALNAVHFWETATTNRGVVVRLFQDRESGLAWLLAPAATA